MTGSQTLIPNKGGRPVEFGPELRIQLLDLLMAGRSNGEACELVGISRDTLHRTIAKDTAFREAYQQAKVLSVDTLIDEADRLADMALKVESGAQAAGIKIALDHAWRKASRIAPQRWGERPAVAVVVNEISGDQEVAKRLAFLQALEACQEGESAGRSLRGHRALMVACSLPRPVMRPSPLSPSGRCLNLPLQAAQS